MSGRRKAEKGLKYIFCFVYPIHSSRSSFDFHFFKLDMLKLDTLGQFHFIKKRHVKM